MTRKKYVCPAEMTISLIGGKWKAVIIYNLRRSARRFGDLKRNCPGITQATLTQQLREMEQNGLVKRSLVGQDRLAGVEYSLTPRGESLKPIIYAMIKWGLTNQKDYVLGEYAMLAAQ